MIARAFLSVTLALTGHPARVFTLDFILHVLRMFPPSPLTLLASTYPLPMSAVYERGHGTNIVSLTGQNI